MSQNLQNFAEFQKIQLDNLVDFEKCCKTHIYLQKSVPIQPKTSNILPKICEELRQHARGDEVRDDPDLRVAGVEELRQAAEEDLPVSLRPPGSTVRGLGLGG